MVDGGEQIKRTGERLAHVDDGPHGIGADLSRRGRWRVARADGNRVRDLPILRTEVQLARGHACLECLAGSDIPTRVPAIRLDKHRSGEEDVDNVRVPKTADLVVADH